MSPLGRVRAALGGSADKYDALAANATRSLGRLLTSICVARLAGADAFATYVLLLTAEIVWTTVANSWFVAPMTTVAPGLDGDERRRVTSHALRRHGAACSLAGLMVLAATPLAGAFGLAPSLLAAFAVSTSSVSLAHGVRAARQSEFRSASALRADVAAAVLPVACTLIAGATGIDVVSAVFVGSAAGALLGVLVMGRRDDLRRVGPPSPRNLQWFRDLGAPMLGGSVANQVGGRAQPFVLNAAASALEVAHFGAAATCTGPLRMAACALGGVVRPRLALHLGRNDPAAARRTLLLGVGLLAALSLGAALVLVVAGRPLAIAVFGDEFVKLDLVLPFAVLFAAIEAVVGLLVVALQTTDVDGARVATRLRYAAAALGLVLIWPACALFGARGAYAALSVAEAVYAVLAVRHLSNGPLVRLRPAFEHARPSACLAPSRSHRHAEGRPGSAPRGTPAAARS
jgi:O-antigen/teichoic acid export membrane protein